jgi:hypothetical protein
MVTHPVVATVVLAVFMGAGGAAGAALAGADGGVPFRFAVSVLVGLPVAALLVITARREQASRTP